MSDIDDQKIEAMIERAARNGARAALRQIGLHDEDAGHDMRELRGLLESWRATKRTAWATITKFATTALLGAIAAGSWMHLNNGGK